MQGSSATEQLDPRKHAGCPQDFHPFRSARFLSYPAHHGFSPPVYEAEPGFRRPEFRLNRPEALVHCPCGPGAETRRTAWNAARGSRRRHRSPSPPDPSLYEVMRRHFSEESSEAKPRDRRTAGPTYTPGCSASPLRETTLNMPRASPRSTYGALSHGPLCMYVPKLGRPRRVVAPPDVAPRRLLDTRRERRRHVLPKRVIAGTSIMGAALADAKGFSKHALLGERLRAESEPRDQHPARTRSSLRLGATPSDG